MLLVSGFHPEKSQPGAEFLTDKPSWGKNGIIIIVWQQPTNLNGKKYLSASSLADSGYGSGRTEEMLVVSGSLSGSVPTSSWISWRAVSQAALSWALWDFLVSLKIASLYTTVNVIPGAVLVCKDLVEGGQYEHDGGVVGLVLLLALGWVLPGHHHLMVSSATICQLVTFSRNRWKKLQMKKTVTSTLCNCVRFIRPTHPI